MAISVSPMFQNGNVFANAVNPPQEEDWFASYFEERDEEITMDELLRGYYYENEPYKPDVKVAYEPDDWVQLWRTYLEWDVFRNTVWTLKEEITSWDEVERILENLDIIRDEDEEVFEKLFTSNFVSCFLNEIFLVAEADGASNKIFEKRVKSLALWIQKHKVCEFKSDDFWKVLTEKNKCSMAPHDLDKSLAFSRLWRLCCLTPLYIDMNEIYQKSIYHRLMPDGQWDNGRATEIMLDMCDGVVGHDEIKKDIVKAFVVMKQKELLYRCLKKNFLSTKDAKYGVSAAMKAKSYELIPMLMMKVHKQWPEIERE